MSETQLFWAYVIAIAAGLFMAWSIGANDVANAMGTSVGSGALTLRNAIIVAAIFEFLGAFFVGQHVSETIRKGILPIEELGKITDADGVLVGANLYVYGMMGAILAAATWLLVATYFGLPVSTTHSIVGSVLGFGIVVFWGNLDVIEWGTVMKIVSSWIISPLLAGGFSCLVFLAIQRLVLYKRDMVGAARKVAPFLIFLVLTIISLVTIYKGLKPLSAEWKEILGLLDVVRDVDIGSAEAVQLVTKGYVYNPEELWFARPLNFAGALLYAAVIGLVSAIGSIPLLKRITVEEESSSEEAKAQNPLISQELARLKTKIKKLTVIADGDVEEKLSSLGGKIEALSTQLEEQESSVKSSGAGKWGTPQMRATERIFVYLQILSACTVAFAHGANDVANAIGPLSGVITVLKTKEVTETSNLSDGWMTIILALGGVGIVIGLVTWGYKVIETIGKKITELTPTRGFSVQFGAAITILVASRAGLPISTTHTLVGAVLGVGFARGIGALNLRVVRDIIISWVMTLPAGAFLAILFFYILKGIFG
ncbi:MAG: anion permease [Planctomycetota bacterium]